MPTDTIYTVSGARDHFREQSRTSGFQIERVPEFKNFFSELPTHPSQTFRFKHNDKLPPFIDREFVPTFSTAAQRNQMSQWTNVTGSNRFKFFRRPQFGAKLPFAMPLPQPAPVTEGGEAFAGEAGAPAPGGAVTVGTQSDYRESEAQTMPYSPDYVLTEAEPNPEVLMLAGLKFGQGLPGGLPEVEMVEKAREKAAFEASLPASNDLANLPLRKRMMEAWETKEYHEREAELAKLQDERLEVLKQQLEAREESRERRHADRLDALKRTKLEEKRKAFAYIQRRRITTVRKLAGQRRRLETGGREKRDIINEYADGASEVYAPLTRNGVFRDKTIKGKEINPEPFTPKDLASVTTLESSVPRKAVQAKVVAPVPKAEREPHNNAARQERAITARLDHIAGLLETSKAEGGRGHGDAWPRPNEVGDKGLKRTTRRRGKKIGDRPETPELPPSGGENADAEAAARLLQRLLRGRAAQNAMHEGKEQRLALVRELHTRRPAYADPSLAADAQMAEETLGAAVATLLQALSSGDAGGVLVRPPTAPADKVGITEDDAATLIQSMQRGRRTRAEVIALRAQRVADEEAAAAARAAAAAAAAAAEARPKSVDFDAVADAPAPTTERSAEEVALSADEAKAVASDVTAELVRSVVLEGLSEEEVSDDAMEELVAELSFIAREQGAIAMESLEKGVRPMSRGSKRMAESGAQMVADEALSSLFGTTLDRSQTPGAESQGAATEGAGELPDLATFTDDDVKRLTAIQAAARGKIARAQIASKKAGTDFKAETALRDVEDLLQLPDLTPEDTARLVKIQSAARGHLARKQLQKQRAAEAGASTSAAEAEEEELPDLAGFSEEEVGRIAKIQATMRGKAFRRKMKSDEATADPADTAADTAAPAEE